MQSSFQVLSDSGDVVDYRADFWPVETAVVLARLLMPLAEPLIKAATQKGASLADLDVAELVNSLVNLFKQNGDFQLVKQVLAGVVRIQPQTKKEHRLPEFMAVYQGNMGEMWEVFVRIIKMNLEGPIKRLMDLDLGK